MYDLRANMPAFGKTRPLKVEDFAEFEKAFGDDPSGKAKRKDQGEQSDDPPSAARPSSLSITPHHHRGRYPNRIHGVNPFALTLKLPPPV